MIPRVDIAGARPVAYIEATLPVGSATDTRQESNHRLENIAIGQQLEAKVISQLKNGTFLVNINDASAHMSLPPGTRAGDTLAMTLLNTEPRMTFLLGANAGAEGAAAKATLSSAGQLINNLLQAAAQGGASTTIIGDTPLLSAADSAAQIAAALRNSLSASGLFYESHQQEWLNGSRLLTDLMQEPQNKASSDARTSAAETTRLLNFVRELGNNGRPIADLLREMQTQLGADPRSQRLLNVVRDWTDGGRSLADLTQTLKSPGSADTLLRADSAATDAARLLNQQLNTLENQRVSWRGDLWPGQPLEWEVSRDAPESENEEAPQSWQSVVRFELPTLGVVSATINMVGERVYMQVKTSSDAAASSLREHGTALIDAMDAAGTPLDSLTVNKDGEI